MANKFQTKEELYRWLVTLLEGTEDNIRKHKRPANLNTEECVYSGYLANKAILQAAVERGSGLFKDDSVESTSLRKYLEDSYDKNQNEFYSKTRKDFSDFTDSELEAFDLGKLYGERVLIQFILHAFLNEHND